MSIHPKSALVLAAFAALLSSPAATAAVLCVRPGGSDADTGACWDHAKATVQGAINAAAEGDEIWVAAGTYAEHVANRVVSEVPVNVALYGGFAGTETARAQRDVVAHRTILDGTNSGIVVSITGGAGPATRLDGFDVVRGYATGTTSYGGGIYILGSAPVIANNRIMSNLADGAGGGMLVWAYRVVPPEAQAQILDNVIYGNRAADGGAGIAMVGASPEIRRNVVARNYTSGFGGGLGCWTTESAKICSPTIANNLIYENSANFKDVGALLGGGGIFASGHGLDGRAIAFGVSAPLVEDNVIAANGAVEKGGGIALVDSDIQAATILNNTIFANNGSAVYWSQTFPTIANNIVAFNTWGLERENEGATAATVLANDVYGNAVRNAPADYKGIADQTGLGGNISADPRLVDYATGRFHIQSNSPCVGAGNAAYAGTGRTDIDGQARVLGSAVDIGADESDGTQWDATIPVIHVLPTGDDAHDGLAWATAVKTVTAGINAAQAYGADVWVGAGTYVERFWLPAWIHLYGGFAGTETTRAARDPRLHETILDGDGTPNVVFSALAGHLVSALDGFTVRNGGVYTGGAVPSPNRPGGRGGGIDCNVSSPLIANNVVARNSLGDPFTVTDSTGGGLGLYGSYALVTGNTFTDNEVLESSGQGGAILISSGAPLISGNVIGANHARYGAAIYAVKARPAIVGNTITQNSHYLQTPLYMGSPEGAVDIWLCQDVDIERNTVSGNVAFTGAGITVQSTFQGRISDNVVAGNVARDSSGGGGIGGGIYVEIVQQPTGTLAVVNNTIVGNTASDSFLGERGGGLAIVLLSASDLVANNLDAFNSSGIWQHPGSSASTTLAGNNVYNTGGNYFNLGQGATDLSVDPSFADRAGGDYHLVFGSPCIDAGSNGAVAAGELDRDGSPRMRDGNADGAAVVDIGAYESTDDRDGDGAPDFADCAPLDATVWAVPIDVGDVVIAADKTHLSWRSLATLAGTATVYDLVRGAADQFPVGAGAAETCLASGIAATSWNDTTAVPPGKAIYYVIRGRNVCGNGPYGAQSNGSQRSTTVCR